MSNLIYPVQGDRALERILPILNASIEVLNREAYDDRDTPSKPNFKGDWRRWPGVEVEYRINLKHLVKGYRGKTVWYIPVNQKELADELKIKEGFALKIVKHLVRDSLISEHERLILEMKIQKKLNAHKMAPAISGLTLVKNSNYNEIGWFEHKYIHPKDSLYLASIVEHIIPEEFPAENILMNEKFDFTGKIIDEFTFKCEELGIVPYDLCLGNIFYFKKQICVVDVHKWRFKDEVS